MAEQRRLEVVITAVTDRFEQSMRRVQDTFSGANDSFRQGAQRSNEAFNGMAATLGAGVGMLANPVALAGVAIGGLAVGAVAAGKAGLDMAIQFQDAGATLQSSMGLSAQQTEQFKGAMEESFASARGTVDEIASAYQLVGTTMQTGATDTQKFADNALVLQKRFGIDVRDSVKAVDMMIKNLGVSGDEAFDIIARTSQVAGDKADDLLDTFWEYSVQFGEMGLSAEQFSGILAQGAQDGVYNFDKMADGIKEFNIRIKDGSKSTNDAMTALFGMQGATKIFDDLSSGAITGADAMKLVLTELNNIDDPLKREQAGVALFGTQWEDVGDKAMLGMLKGMEGLEGVDGAMKKVTATSDATFGQSMQRVQNSFLLIAKHIGDALLPYLQKFASFIEKNMPAIELIVKGVMTAIGIAITPAVVAFKVVLEAVTAVVNFIQSAFPAIKSVVTSVWNTVSSSCQTAWNVVVSAVTTAWNTVVSTIQGAVGRVRSAIANVVSAIKNAFAGAGTWLLQAGRDIINGLISGIKSMVSKVASTVKSVASTVKNTITSALKIHSPSKVMEEIGVNIVQGLTQGMDSQRGAIEESSLAMAKAVADGGDIAVQGINDAMSKVNNGISMELDLLEQKYKLWKVTMGEVATESELLAKEQEYQQLQLEMLKGKVDIANQAYEAMKKVKGETAEETKKLQLELLKESIAYQELANQIANANKVQKESLTSSPLGGQAGRQAIANAYISDGHNVVGWDGSVIEFDDGTKIDMGSGNANKGGSSKKSSNIRNSYDPELKKRGLAEGGIAISPTWRLFGEAGPEAVLPLAKLGPMITASMLSVFNRFGGGSSIDYDKLGQAIAKYNKPSVNMYNTFNSPEPLTPKKVRREQELLMRKMAMSF